MPIVEPIPVLLGRVARCRQRSVLIPQGTLHTFSLMKIEGMNQAVDDATELLKALANRNRLLLLCNMIEGEKSVGELARLIAARETAVSQQLMLLRKDGLVRTRRAGQTIYYALASSNAERVIETLHSLFCAPMTDHAADDQAPVVVRESADAPLGSDAGT